MFTRTLLLAVAACSLGSLTSPAAVQEHAVEYKAGETACEGYVAFDDAAAGDRPGVLVVHDWMGLSDHTKGVCRKLAELGYVAFAADIYGKGVRPADMKAAGAEAGKYKNDRALLRERAAAALAQLKASPHVAAGKLAAIGYCFGGTTAIELARAGADLTAVVSFHGGLDSPNPADGKNIKAHMLILHGADDPMVKPADLEAFQKEMRDNHIDWEMVYYGDAVHAFTVERAGNDKSKGIAYNEKAAKRSWQAMQDFFAELFPR